MANRKQQNDKAAQESRERVAREAAEAAKAAGANKPKDAPSALSTPPKVEFVVNPTERKAEATPVHPRAAADRAKRAEELTADAIESINTKAEGIIKNTVIPERHVLGTQEVMTQGPQDSSPAQENTAKLAREAQAMLKAGVPHGRLPKRHQNALEKIKNNVPSPQTSVPAVDEKGNPVTTPTVPSKPVVDEAFTKSLAARLAAATSASEIKNILGTKPRKPRQPRR